MSTEGKKWSTFLQKPLNPIPKCISDDPIIPPDQLYRVVIRRGSTIAKEAAQALADGLNNFNPETPSENLAENPELIINHQEEPPEFVTEMEISLGLIEQDAISNTEFEPENTPEEAVPVPEELEQESKTENENCNEITENAKQFFPEELLSGASLENKLSEIQKQLQAMAELPTFIQGDLDELTKKLSNIMYVVNERVEAEKIEEEENCANMENENCEEENEERKSEVSEQETIESQVEEEAAPAATEAQEEIQETEEEIIDPAVLEKLKKMEQVEGKKRKPPQRPIVLPGGRRWCEEGDVKTSYRNVKMSDEKIDTTISTYTEVITGKTKGINFLKYQPHPKNMQFLQESEVYKLVHDIETPVMGICRRSGKILAENDYYEKKNEVVHQLQ